MGDRIYIAVVIGIHIAELIAVFVWLYKDRGVKRVLEFIVAVALVCAAAAYITR